MAGHCQVTTKGTSNPASGPKTFLRLSLAGKDKIRVAGTVSSPAAFRSINEIGFSINGNGGGPTDLWIMSDRFRHDLYHEKNKLIQAKIRAIIATAVFGASFAVALGALIATKSAKSGKLAMTTSAPH